VGADNFLPLRMDHQIHSFKGICAKQDFIFAGQNDGFTGGFPVFPADFHKLGYLAGGLYTAGQRSFTGLFYFKPQFLADFFVDYQRPCAGVNQGADRYLPDLILWYKTPVCGTLVSDIYQCNFRMHFTHICLPVFKYTPKQLRETTAFREKPESA
jgi:hypothetical protein